MAADVTAAPGAYGRAAGAQAPAWEGCAPAAAPPLCPAQGAAAPVGCGAGGCSYRQAAPPPCKLRHAIPYRQGYLLCCHRLPHAAADRTAAAGGGVSVVVGGFIARCRVRAMRGVCGLHGVRGVRGVFGVWCALDLALRLCQGCVWRGAMTGSGKQSLPSFWYDVCTESKVLLTLALPEMVFIV